MSFSTMNDDMNIIAALGDEPNEDNGLTAAGLKAKFDSAGKLCKAAINKLIGELQAKTAAASFGFSRSTNVPADTVQAAIENVQSQIAGVSQGAVANGSITAAKLCSNAAGFEDISSNLTITNTMPDSYPCDMSGVRFMFSRALGMLFIVGTAGFTKTGTGSYYARFEITGPYNFGYYGSCFSCKAVEGDPRVSCDPLGNQLQIDVVVSNASANPYNNYVGVDMSGWLFCQETT